MDRADKQFHEWCQDAANASLIHNELHKLYANSRKNSMDTDLIDDDASMDQEYGTSKQTADATEGA